MKIISMSIYLFFIKCLRRSIIFLVHSGFTMIITLGIALSLMYFMDAWKEGYWQSFWIAIVFQISMFFLVFAIPLHIILLLIYRAKKSFFVNISSKLCYILCVITIGTTLTWAALMEIGYQYHGWD